MRQVKGLCFVIISVSLFISHLVETTDLFFDEDLLQIQGPIYSHNPEAVDTLHNYIRNFMKTGKKLGSNCLLEHQQKMLERREYYVVQLNSFKLPYNRTMMRRLLNESFVDVKKWPQYCQFHPFWQKPTSDFHCDSLTGKCCTFSLVNSSMMSGNGSESKSLLCSPLTTTMKPLMSPLPFSTSFSKSSTRRVYPTYVIKSGNNNNSMAMGRINDATSPSPMIITDKPGLNTNTNESISSALSDPLPGPPPSTMKNNNSDIIQPPEGQKSPSTNNAEFFYATLKNNGSLPENITVELNLLSSTTPPPPPLPTTTTTPTMRATTITSLTVKEKAVQYFTSNSLNNNCNSTDFSRGSSLSVPRSCSQFTLFFFSFFFLSLSTCAHFPFSSYL